MSRRRGLQVVRGGRSQPPAPPRPVFHQRRRLPRPRWILEALLLMAAGVGLLVLLLQLPELIDLDSLLLISKLLHSLRRPNPVSLKSDLTSNEISGKKLIIGFCEAPA